MSDILLVALVLPAMAFILVLVEYAGAWFRYGAAHARERLEWEFAKRRMHRSVREWVDTTTGEVTRR